MPYIRVRLETWTVLIGGTILTTTPCPCMESAACLKYPNFASLILNRISFQEEWPLLQKCLILISYILILLFIIYLMYSTAGMQTFFSITYFIVFKYIKEKEQNQLAKLFQTYHLQNCTKWLKYLNHYSLTFPSWSVYADFPTYLSTRKYICGNSHRRKDKYDHLNYTIYL